MGNGARDQSMMLRADTGINEQEIRRKLGRLANESGKVLARASNRALRTGRNVVAKETQKRYLITKDKVNKTCRVRWAKAQDPYASVTYSGSHRNLYLWGDENGSGVSPDLIIRWQRGKKPNVEAYSARVKRDRAPVRLGGNSSNKPFLQKTRGGFTGLFRRSSASRSAPLEGVGGPAIPQIIKNDEIEARFQKKASETMQKRVEHEIDRILGGGR